MGIHDEESVQQPQAQNSTEGEQQTLNRAEYNVANEKQLEDDLQITEPKVVDYVPGKN